MPASTMSFGVSKSGSPISRWTISLPWRSRARALFSTSKAVSVPRRDILSARRSSYWVDFSIAAKLVIISPPRGRVHLLSDRCRVLNHKYATFGLRIPSGLALGHGSELEFGTLGKESTMALDMDKLNAFVGRFVGDLGAAVHAGMVVIGERLGLYKALAEQPMTSGELAANTATDERYVREWLASQAAGGYVTYDEKTNMFSLSEEQAFALANEDSPAYLPGAFQLALGSLAAVPRIADSFRSGAGMGWGEHDEGV